VDRTNRSLSPGASSNTSGHDNDEMVDLAANLWCIQRADRMVKPARGDLSRCPLRARIESARGTASGHSRQCQGGRIRIASVNRLCSGPIGGLAHTSET